MKTPTGPPPLMSASGLVADQCFLVLFEHSHSHYCKCLLASIGHPGTFPSTLYISSSLFWHFRNLPLPGAGGAVVGGRAVAEPCNANECMLTKSIECHSGDKGQGVSSTFFGVLGTYPFKPSHLRKPFCAKSKAVSPSGIDT